MNKEMDGELLIAGSGIDKALLCRFPVRIEQIAYDLGAKSIRQADIPIDGFLNPGEDGFTILLNKNHLIVKQRFSCAHEVAHALLDSSSPARRSLPVSSGSLESQCEKIASILLMPNPGFRNHLVAYGHSIESIIKLAQIFLTSIQATAIRFIDMVEEPCVLIVSHFCEGKSGRKLRVYWSKQNTLRPDGRSRFFVPKGISLNLNTASIAYRTGHIQSDVEEIDVGGLKVKAHTESRGFGTGSSRYVLTLIFPDRTESVTP